MHSLVLELVGQPERGASLSDEYDAVSRPGHFGKLVNWKSGKLGGFLEC